MDIWSKLEVLKEAKLGQHIFKNVRSSNLFWLHYKERKLVIRCKNWKYLRKEKHGRFLTTLCHDWERFHTKYNHDVRNRMM